MRAIVVSAPRNSVRLDLRSEVAQHKQADRGTEIDAALSLPVDRVDQVDHPFVAGPRLPGFATVASTISARSVIEQSFSDTPVDIAGVME
jgi:hypothetical protein